MEIGWIDFSNKDKKRALDLIDSLKASDTVDQLGLSRISDGFSEFFFPGTTTIQTRAKYFLIVPYALLDVSEEIIKSPMDLKRFKDKLKEKEKQCCEMMKKNCVNKETGIIGGDSIKDEDVNWIARTPREIYWNGMRKFKIIKEVTSLANFRQIIVKFREKSNRNDIYEKVIDKRIVDKWNKNRKEKEWKTNLNIELDADEKNKLKDIINGSIQGTLFEVILNNKGIFEKIIENSKNFSDFYNNVKKNKEIKDIIREENLEALHLANEFNKLAKILFYRYNYIICGDKKEFAKKYEKRKFEWGKDTNFKNKIELIYEKLNLKNYKNLKETLCEIVDILNKETEGSIDALIEKIEIDNKGESKSKISKKLKEEFKSENWIGLSEFNYRYNISKRIIEDIWG